MRPFPQPHIEPITERLYRVVEPYVYAWAELGVVYRLEVPAGFVTDLASVPRVLWWLYRPDGLYRAAVVVHDRLYRHAGSPPGFTMEGAGFEPGTPARLDRSGADEVMLGCSRAAGVSALDRHLMFLAVVLCGGSRWGAPPEWSTSVGA